MVEDGGVPRSWVQCGAGWYLILSRLHYEQKPVSGLAPVSGQVPIGGSQPVDGDVVESTLSGSVAILDSRSAQVVWEGRFSSTRSGVDTDQPSPLGPRAAVLLHDRR